MTTKDQEQLIEHAESLYITLDNLLTELSFYSETIGEHRELERAVNDAIDTVNKYKVSR